MPTEAVIGIEDLEKHGLAHIEIPYGCRPSLLPEGVLSEWISSVEDGTRLELSAAYGDVGLAIDRIRIGIVSGCLVRPEISGGPIAAIRRIEYEEDGWHYDIGEEVLKENYLVYVNRPGLPDQEPHSLGVMLPFPLGLQKPTVVESWANGRDYQAPDGYATLFFPHLSWHRGDNQKGHPRGVFMQGFQWNPTKAL